MGFGGERRAGVLLHLASLPGGPAGGGLRRFVELIAAAGFSVWQILPLGPAGAGRNPFTPASAFAFDPELAAAGGSTDPQGFARFAVENAGWLEDWALFAALRQAHGGQSWWDWPAPLRRREAPALAAARVRHADAIRAAASRQYRCDVAWRQFRQLAGSLGIRVFGDVPLYVGRDSADVWAHRELFDVDADGRFGAGTGVPPDAFSAGGQVWGSPAYRWNVMAATGFAWWKRRFAVQAARHDLLRIDHFRGLAAWWRVPPGAPTAAGGEWIPGPGRAAIDALGPVLGGTQLVAEDLGVITEDVIALRRSLGLPGMRVLQFAFDGKPDNEHLPRNHGPDTVCYTGTHDNDTTLGWWRALDAATRAEVVRVLGTPEPAMPRALVELAWSSPAPLAVVPMQDLLALGSEARLNRPGVDEGNWRWALRWQDIPADFAPRVHADLTASGRCRVADSRI